MMRSNHSLPLPLRLQSPPPQHGLRRHHLETVADHSRIVLFLKVPKNGKITTARHRLMDNLMAPIYFTLFFFAMLIPTGDSNAEHIFRGSQDASPIYSASLNQLGSVHQTNPQKDESQINDELNLINDDLHIIKGMIAAGRCNKARTSLNQINPKIIAIRNPLLKHQKGEAWEGINERKIFTEIHWHIECLSEPNRTVKLLNHLQQETKTGNEIAKKALDGIRYFLEDLSEKEINKESRRLIMNVPTFSDYGTDMLSLSKYNKNMDKVSTDACRNEWVKRKMADAAYCLSLRYAGDASEMMLMEAAKLGHPIAQNNLASKMDEGESPRNSLGIVELLMASANSGIPHAQVTIGWFYMVGEHGFKIDYTEAMKWNLMAYKQGHPEGANNIGELYENGFGVTKDINQANIWYKRSSVLGNAEATVRVRKLEALMK
jgi:hypothetical protein